MKHFLILALLAAAPAFAGLTLGLERSTPLGLDSVVVDFSQDSARLTKTSNWFDRKEDLRLGEFLVSGKVVDEIKRELEALHAEIKKANDRLEAQGTSFNELNSNREPHAPYFRVGDFKVQKFSLLYPRLEALARKIELAQLRLENGILLDRSKASFVFFESGKEAKREPFNARFFCADARFPTRCLAREWGAFYLE